MNCQICDAEEAAFTIIPTGPGDPQSLGPACFARAGLEAAKQLLPAEEIAEALGPMFVQPAEPPPTVKASKSVKANAVEAAPDEITPQGETGGTAEVPAAAADK